MFTTIIDQPLSEAFRMLLDLRSFTSRTDIYKIFVKMVDKEVVHQLLLLLLPSYLSCILFQVFCRVIRCDHEVLN